MVGRGKGVYKVQKGRIFFGAMLYGTSWIVGLINLLAAILALSEGNDSIGYLPMILMPFSIILLVHQLNGWFPFRRRP